MGNNITIAAGSMLLTNVSDKVIFAGFLEKKCQIKRVKNEESFDSYYNCFHSYRRFNHSYDELLSCLTSQYLSNRFL